MSFGDRLLKIRKKKNISQEQLAREIGVTRQTVSNWELNTTIPNIDDLKKISEALNISYDKLLNSNSSKNEEKNEKLKTSKLVMIILKVIGILFILNIFIIGIIFIIWKINYEQNLEYASYSLKCTYNESSYRYNIAYNKKNKIVNATIEGNVKEVDKNIKWIDDLDKFVFSKEITDAFELQEYIMNKYKENGGKC